MQSEQQYQQQQPQFQHQTIAPPAKHDQSHHGRRRCMIISVIATLFLIFIILLTVCLLCIRLPTVSGVYFYPSSQMDLAGYNPYGFSMVSAALTVYSESVINYTADHLYIKLFFPQGSFNTIGEGHVASVPIYPRQYSTLNIPIQSQMLMSYCNGVNMRGTVPVRLIVYIDAFAFRDWNIYEADTEVPCPYAGSFGYYGGAYNGPYNGW